MTDNHTGPGRAAAEPGVGLAELVPTRGARTGLGVAISAGCTTLGRRRDCDIVLEDAAAAAYHAELYHAAPAFYTLIDSGSLNGLYLNRHLRRRAALADGDEIWIGKSRFLFHHQPAPATPPP